jgi:pimeloyl-ACP methyl ester carboxylesterase
VEFASRKNDFSAPVFCFQLLWKSSTLFVKKLKSRHFGPLFPPGERASLRLVVGLLVGLGFGLGASSAGAVVFGDLNHNASLDIGDAIKQLRTVVGLDIPDFRQLYTGDVAPLHVDGTFGDGQVNLADVQRLLRRIAGLENSGDWPGAQSNDRPPPTAGTSFDVRVNGSQARPQAVASGAAGWARVIVAPDHSWVSVNYDVPGDFSSAPTAMTLNLLDASQPGGGPPALSVFDASASPSGWSGSGFRLFTADDPPGGITGVSAFEDVAKAVEGGAFYLSVATARYPGGEVRGYPPVYRTEDFAYPSSIDPAINNLFARVGYYPQQNDLPVVLLMHGYNQSVSDFQPSVFSRLAAQGLFVCAVSMRGRDGAYGAPDSDGREIYDIYDALQAIRKRYAGLVSPDYAAVVGYSGGGANALACATKFPDAFTDIVSHFGISDFGHAAETSWWRQAPDYQNLMRLWIGGSPSEVPDRYMARYAVDGVLNYTGGFLYLFHDRGDTTVPVIQSIAVANSKRDAGQMNFLENYTSITDPIRWKHSLPDETAPVRNTEAIWAPGIAAKRHVPWTIPAQGTLRVRGYVVTKRFALWLGDGTDEAADVTYDADARTYAVTPLTGEMDVTLTQGTATLKRHIAGPAILRLDALGPSSGAGPGSPVSGQ